LPESRPVTTLVGSLALEGGDDDNATNDAFFVRGVRLTFPDE